MYPSFSRRNPFTLWFRMISRAFLWYSFQVKMERFIVKFSIKISPRKADIFLRKCLRM